MRRFFSRSPKPEQLLAELKATDQATQRSALAQLQRLGSGALADTATQETLIDCIGSTNDAAFARDLFQLLEPGQLTPALLATDVATQGFLQFSPDPERWPAPLRDHAALLRRHLRQQVQAAPDTPAALALLGAPTAQALALEDQLPAWLSRRDLQDALFEHPPFAASQALQLIERLSRGHNKAVNRTARQKLQAIKEAAEAAAAAAARANELKQAATRLIQEATRAGVRTPRDDAAMAALAESWVPFAADHGELPPWPDAVPTTAALEAAEAARQAAELAAAEAQKQAAAEARAKAAQAQEAPAMTDGGNTDPAALTPVAAPGAQDTGPAAGEAAVAVASTEAATETEATADQPLTEAQRAERKARLSEAVALLSDVEAAVEAGSARQANPLLAKLRNTLGDDLRLAKSDRARLAAAQAKVREWGQWQAFATSPKRTELLDAMTRAATSPLAPEPQAEKIKELRQQWRELGPLRSAADRAQASAFDEAAEQAFEPCRAHFAALGEQREANAKARESLCETLQTYLEETDWAKADYDAAEKILRQARTDWRALHPVPRNRERSLSERFEALQSKLYDRLQQHWNRRRAIKEGLVQRAEALLQDSAPLAERTTQAKQLQRDWQDAGRLPRKDDQALWKQFRGALDALFDTQQAAYQAARSERDAQEQAITQALTDLSAGIETPEAAALQHALILIDPLLEALPPRERRRLEADVERHVSAYRKALQALRAQATQQQIAALFAWDQAAAAGEPLPAEAPAALKGEACNKTLQELTTFVLRCEMRAEVDSPAADRATRMQLKLEQLQSGRGTDDALTQMTPLELAEHWCELGPKGAVDAQDLRQRLRHALAALS